MQYNSPLINQSLRTLYSLRHCARSIKEGACSATIISTRIADVGRLFITVITTDSQRHAVAG